MISDDGSLSREDLLFVLFSITVDWTSWASSADQGVSLGSGKLWWALFTISWSFIGWLDLFGFIQHIKLN